jgi:hypothetical protein
VLTEEIDDLNQQLVNFQVHHDELALELEARKNALESAQKSLHREGSHRLKTEALKGVISRINLHFRHTDKKGRPTLAKSTLESLEIVPVTGNSLIVTKEVAPAPD